MGTKEDLLRRKKIRTDNQNRRDKVQNSLDLIYKRGRAVDTAAIEDLLREHSWVPTAVSSPSPDGIVYFSQIRFRHRMRFPSNCLGLFLTFIECSYLTLCTNLILASGVQRLSI